MRCRIDNTCCFLSVRSLCSITKTSAWLSFLHRPLSCTQRRDDSTRCYRCCCYYLAFSTPQQNMSNQQWIIVQSSQGGDGNGSSCHAFPSTSGNVSWVAAKPRRKHAQMRCDGIICFQQRITNYTYSAYNVLKPFVDGSIAHLCSSGCKSRYGKSTM
jgi:hypothetical protein